MGLEQIDLDQIQDVEQAKRAIAMLFNLLEEMQTTVRQLQVENQRLRDENNRLKGEKGKPTIKPDKHAGKGSNHSSEAERRKAQGWHKESKLETIRIDREQVLTIDRAQLPTDAEFKGYEDTVVQDVMIRTDNVLYHKEKYYSPSERQTYLAELPPGYCGQFGPGIKALALVQYYAYNMSEPKIREFFGNVGIRLSAGELSAWLIKDWPELHAEKDAIYAAGLRSSPWQHIDDTAAREWQQPALPCGLQPSLHGVFHNCRQGSVDSLGRIAQLADPHLPGQCGSDRVSARVWPIAARRAHGAEPAARAGPERDGDPASTGREAAELGTEAAYAHPEATGVAAYHAHLEFPVVKLLICDDAPQFNWLTEELALCWIHEGRHYKKLEPYVPQHRTHLAQFLRRFWEFYNQLLTYRQQPGPDEKTRLSAEFDILFATVTSYRALDERIEITKLKKASLLMVLDHPEILLHNNPAELGARLRVRKRDVSFGPRTPDGAKAWDTFMTLTATAKKLGVSIYHYIHDRVSATRDA